VNKSSSLITKDIKEFLDEKVIQYNSQNFIESDPIQVPHQFSKKEDIEIAGFLTASISWGQRVSIIKNAFRLINLMDNDPHNFIINASESDLKSFKYFVHRTFQGIDCVFFIQSLKNIYINHNGLERVFTSNFKESESISASLIGFRKIFFEIPYPKRTLKHISDVSSGASAKRLNMYLRWMVRKDSQNVDFGHWKNIPASALHIPLDIHTGNVARKLMLLSRKQNDWKAVEELTSNLRQFDPEDPVKYDYALFGLGAFEKFA
jgi:uncharacterized protein (TIGR02757 family)